MNDYHLLHPLENRKKSRRKSNDYRMVRIRTEHNGFGFLKTLLTLLLVFLQLGIILSFNFFFAIGLSWYLTLLAVISLFTAVSVLSSHRSGQAKAVWVFFILVFFVFGFVVYFMSNDRIMYRRARNRHKKIFERSGEFVKPYADPQTENGVLTNCRYLYHSGGFVPYSNTAVKYFSSGSAMFDDVIERLKSAEKFVFMEFFAVADGVLLNRILDVLKEKMERGVDVRIIYDDMGSRVLSLKTRKKIRQAGGQIRVFNRLVSRFTFALNYRDHRKIIVVDGKCAYTGGCNLADEYVNEKRMYGYWKDVGLRLDGEAVDAMTLAFLRQWEFIVKKPVDYGAYLRLSEKHANSCTVLPFTGGPEFEHPICKSVFENAISAAKKKLYIMTPYFVPDDSMTGYIVNAALSGVDVRIVLPSVPDKFYVYLMTKDNAEKLTKYGVKVYYMEDAFVHAKVLLNENCAVIGSANFDMRTFYQQFENAVLCNDKQLLEEVEADFERTFRDSRAVTSPQKKSLPCAVAVSALRLVAPLM